MLKWLPGPVKGVLNWIYLVSVTIFWSVPMYIFFIFKYLLPFKAWREFWSDRLHDVGYLWARSNNFIMHCTMRTHWDIEGLPKLSSDKWYFVACNHQSWSDVLVVTYVLADKIPFIKYFVKDTLKYLPVIGLAWWAFEFPVMKRHSAKRLSKKPELRNQDIQTTLNSCKKCLRKPSTLLSFVEGTRFTNKKHQKQKSPYKHLLKPKPGGVALSIKALKDHIDSIIHVTIIYPEGQRSFWQFMCGRLPRVKILVEEVPIPQSYKSGDYVEDKRFREDFKAWLNGIWQQTDQKIDKLKQQGI